MISFQLHHFIIDPTMQISVDLSLNSSLVPQSHLE